MKKKVNNTPEIDKNISKAVKNQMEDLNLKSSDIAERLNIKRQDVEARINNNARWNLEMLVNVFKILNMNVNDFLSYSKEKPRQSSGEKRGIKIFGRINAGIPAMMWTESDMEYELEMNFPILKKYKTGLYGFIVSGDSMAPRFTNGDTVIAKLLNLPSEKPRNKDFVITTFNSDEGTSSASLKLFTWRDSKKEEFVLSSLNTRYAPSVHHLKEVRNIFRVYLAISEVHYKQTT